MKKEDRKQKIIDHYKLSGYYAVTARKFGISRQRVHQIVTEYVSNKKRSSLK